MSLLVARIISARRKRVLGSRPIYVPYGPATDKELSRVEQQVNSSLPPSLKAWLLEAGFGDFNEELALRTEWFRVVDRGQLKGHVLFAQDVLGDFFCFSPEDGSIHFICRSAPEYAFMAHDFSAFLEELERRSFELLEWVNALPVIHYDWASNPSIERTCQGPLRAPCPSAHAKR